MIKNSNLLFSFLVLVTFACSPSTEVAREEAKEIQEETGEYYELRIYHLSEEQSKDAVIDYVSKEVVPAYKAAGVEMIGAFTNVDSAASRVYLLLPFATLDEFGSITAAVSKKLHQSTSAYYTGEIPENKRFERINSTLMTAFELFPHMKAPRQNPNRFFELRSYESYSEMKGINKVKMFNEGGEVDIFEELDFQPVFFAESIIGDQRPNLVYMTTHESQESVGVKWKGFVEHPVWKSIVGMDVYLNTVSKMHKDFLIPLPVSDI